VRVEVYDFRRKTVVDAKGVSLGSCRRERGKYVRRDNDGVVLWTLQPQRGFSSTSRVFDEDGSQIGSIRKRQLFVADEQFATLERITSSTYRVLDGSGRFVAALTNESRLWHFHQTIEIRFVDSLSGVRRHIVAATTCVLEASATLGE
jgi:hypothetical protein